MVCSVGTGTFAEYYLNEQMQYYTCGEEPKGRWYSPSEDFGLEDATTIDDSFFINLHAGKSPQGTLLAKSNHSFATSRVGGYDLTFSAPKSVSVLWAISEPKIKRAIEAAQENAVRAALGVLHENAGYARRGKGGTVLEKVRFLGATFQHGEARPTKRFDGTIATDPQLHTHSVIFNIAQRSDGTWGALDGRHFYQWKMAAGAIYRARLAQELRYRLDLGIELQPNGLFDLAGVPKSVRDRFSSRRFEIEASMADKGLLSGDAQALASTVARSSRRGKTVNDETALSRHLRWRKEAGAIGFLHDAQPAVSNPMPMPQLSDPVSVSLSDVPRLVTEHNAVFRLEDLYRKTAETMLISGSAGVDVQSVVTSMMENRDVIEIGVDERGLPIYSTQEMVELEKDLVATAQRGGVSKRHRLRTSEINPLMGGRGLTDEQQLAVRIVTMGSDLTVLEGAAGAGKTYALKTASDAYQAKGYRVIGTSTAWLMANQLGDDLGIESRATDSWLTRARAGRPFLNSNTVLIVDEAGQLSSRQMLQVLKEAENKGSKVILTGDQKQLQAIGAGPGLRLVAEQVGVTRIDTIVRQQDEWVRRAVEDFSVGRADNAVAAFEKRGSLVWCADKDSAVKAVVNDWKTSKTDTPDKTAMIISKTNAQVRSLNAEMRRHLRESGKLTGIDHEIGVVNSSGKGHLLKIAVGDQVTFKKRIDDLGVINGTTGKISEITRMPDGYKLSINVEERTITFNNVDIGDEKGRVPLAHGYATTIYSAQGATVDKSFVVADQALTRNEIYVAASRAREKCKIYIDQASVEKSVRSQIPLSSERCSPIPRETLRHHLSLAWGRAQTKSSSRDYHRTEETREMAIGLLKESDRHWKIRSKHILPSINFSR